MKQEDIELCASCNEGIGRKLFFYRVSIEQMILDTGAINQIRGMEMLLGAAAPLASVMGTNPDIAKGTGKKDVFLCGDCGTKPIIPHTLLEGE